MLIERRICELRELLLQQLSPLIDNDYILLGLPYHPNMGDMLIWDGFTEFQKIISHKCLYFSSIRNFVNQSIKKNVIIIFNGGGNFGDIWEDENNFRKSIIETYPHNKVLILPQTIYYSSDKKLAEDRIFFAKYDNVILCTRDKLSYEIGKTLVRHVLLLPDMAFCIPTSLLKKMCRKERDRVLLLERKDHEACHIDYRAYIKEKELPCDIRDWPSYERPYMRMKVLGFLIKYRNLLGNLDNWYARHVVLPSMVRSATAFVSSYKHVYTTRLHVAILSFLLGKPFTFFDNSYGKNHCFYECWMQDVEGVEFVK